MRAFCLVAVVAALAGVVPPAGTVYHVDSDTGDDGYDGLAPTRPWKSLDKVNAATFTAGDRILLRAGSRYEGQLRPHGSGVEGNPIVVNMYGDGAKPLIAAAGKFGEALLLENQDYWEVNNLELTNTGPTREPLRYGARVRAWDHGTMRHIHLRTSSSMTSTARSSNAIPAKATASRGRTAAAGSRADSMAC